MIWGSHSCVQSARFATVRVSCVATAPPMLGVCCSVLIGAFTVPGCAGRECARKISRVLQLLFRDPRWRLRRHLRHRPFRQHFHHQAFCSSPVLMSARVQCASRHLRGSDEFHFRHCGQAAAHRGSACSGTCSCRRSPGANGACCSGGFHVLSGVCEAFCMGLGLFLALCCRCVDGVASMFCFCPALGGSSGSGSSGDSSGRQVWVVPVLMLVRMHSSSALATSCALWQDLSPGHAPFHREHFFLHSWHYKSGEHALAQRGWSFAVVRFPWHSACRGLVVVEFSRT